MASSAILAVTLVPVMMGYFIRGKIISENKNPVNRFLHTIHTPLLKKAMRWRKTTLVLALGLIAATYYPYSKLGSEYSVYANNIPGHFHYQSSRIIAAN